MRNKIIQNGKAICYSITGQMNSNLSSMIEKIEIAVKKEWYMRIQLNNPRFAAR
jgi:hypothetical protein